MTQTQLEMQSPTTALLPTNRSQSTPGSRRVRSVWMQPTTSGQQDQAIPSSAGRWVERSPGSFARVTVAIPVTVGSTLSMR